MVQTKLARAIAALSDPSKNDLNHKPVEHRRQILANNRFPEDNQQITNRPPQARNSPIPHMPNNGRFHGRARDPRLRLHLRKGIVKKAFRD